MTDDVDPLPELVAQQSGVVSARQLLEADRRPHDIKRMLRRRELAAVHRGVYVDHTGPLSRDQREWAAVLAHWPAALARESALPGAGGDGPVHVAIDLGRSAVRIPGVITHRTPDLETRVRWNTSPPRIRVEHAVIDLAVARRDDAAAAFRVIADACQGRHTTCARVRAVLAERSRIPGRGLLEDLLDDLETGACSVLEREWLRVTRTHGLPDGERQLQAVGRRGHVYRDVALADLGVYIELDGRPFHDDAASRDRDAARDLDSAVHDGATTLRLTYGLVFTEGCRTARQVGDALRNRGWTGAPTSCPACSTTQARGSGPSGGPGPPPNGSGPGTTPPGA